MTHHFISEQYTRQKRRRDEREGRPALCEYRECYMLFKDQIKIKTNVKVSIRGQGQGRTISQSASHPVSKQNDFRRSGSAGGRWEKERELKTHARKRNRIRESLRKERPSRYPR